MTTGKNLQGKCSHCDKAFEFPVEAVGTTGECPHCGKQTEIFLAAPAQESHAPRKLVIWTVVGILVLVFGLLAALFAVHLARQLKADPPHPPPSAKQMP